MRRLFGPVATFVVFLAIFSALAGLLLITTHAPGGMLYLVFFEWTPGLAALTTFALHTKVKAFSWRWLSVRKTAGAYALPLVYMVPVYLAAWLLLHRSFDAATFTKSSSATVGFPLQPKLATFGLFVPLSLTFGLLNRFPYTLGEELGWRGFLMPTLRDKYGFAAACLITGVVWAVWHYPLLYAFGLFSGPHAHTQIPFFTVMVIGLSFVFGWLRMKTRSLWACVLMHASHNAFLQTFFDPLTAVHDKTVYVTSEFGCGLMVTVCLTAIIVTIDEKSKELQVPR